MNLKNVKSGAYRDGTCVLDLERGKLKGIKSEPWQTDTSINDLWFYGRNGRYDSTDDVIDMFVDIISKNGNLLFNIPLKAGRHSGRAIGPIPGRVGPVDADQQ